MTLLITVNEKHTCNVTFINFINKVITSKVFMSIVAVSLLLNLIFIGAMKEIIDGLDRSLSVIAA
jgi:hypothetical protein